MFRTLLISLFLTSTALATTWTVDDDGKADFDNIQEAVDAASDGDEILVMPGTYTSTADEVVDMLGKAVILRSSDPNDPDIVAATIIDGQSTRLCIICDNGEGINTIIQGLTIYGGWQYQTGGAGIRCELSSPTISLCVFEHNSVQTSGSGGALSCSGSAIVEDCIFISNSAKHGGAISDGGTLRDLTWRCDVLLRQWQFRNY
jgi:predicted outer membrane repeat protein